MQAMFSDRNGRVLIINRGLGIAWKKKNIHNNKLLHFKKPELTNPYVLSGDNRYEKAKDLLQGRGENYPLFPTPLNVYRSVRQKDFGQPEFLLYIPLLKIRADYVLNTISKKILQRVSIPNITAIINKKSGGFTFPPLLDLTIPSATLSIITRSASVKLSILLSSCLRLLLFARLSEDKKKLIH